MGLGFKDWTAGDVLTAADVDGYLMRQTVMTFADASARDTALSGVLDEGMVAFLEDTNEITVYDGSDWIVYAGRGYSYVQTVYFTSSGTFTKATYPWLRAVRVTVQAGGGGGGHVDTTSAGQCSAGGGGGAGTWAQSLITDIASLASSVTVTVGAAGSGGLYATSTAATDGGNSSFGSGAAYEVSAGGGGGGVTVTRSGASQGSGGTGGGGGVGDLVIQGNGGGGSLVGDPANVYSGQGGKGASSLLGGSGRQNRANQGSGVSSGYGAGGTGVARVESLTGVDGRDGTAGIVIVELYA